MSTKLKYCLYFRKREQNDKTITNSFFKINLSFIFSNNLYFTDGTAKWNYGSASYSNFNNYRINSGQEENSLFANPLLRDPENDNPNLYYVEVDSGTWLILENGSGPKRGWCISGSSAGQSVVYRDASKLSAKAEAKLLASGQWVPSVIFDGYIYKIVQYVEV